MPRQSVQNKRRILNSVPEYDILMDSSKRSLYKPAPIENVGAKENRRALAQGHLVNDSVIPDGLTVYAAPSMDLSEPDTVTTISHGTSGFSNSSMTPPRQALSSLTLSHQVSSLPSDLPSSVPRGPGVTHHYMAERGYSPPRSPSKPSPSRFLELSDSDREYLDHQRTPVRHHTRPSGSGSPVLLVDASGRRNDPSHSEVDVRTENIVSPAKVVCHAPSIVESDFRNSGYTEEAARVYIDSVPTVTVPGDAGSGVGASADHGVLPQSALPDPDLGQAAQSPRILRESSAASDKLGSADSTASTLKPSEVTSLQQRNSHHAMRDVNESSESERPSTAMSIDEGRGASTKKKKKVKGKFVQSRYMQSKPAATPVASDSKASHTATSTTTTTNASRNKTAGRPGSASTFRLEKTRSSSHRPGPVRATASFTHSTATQQRPVSTGRSQSTSNAPSGTAAQALSSHKPAPTGRGQHTPVNKKGSKRFASTPATDTSMLPNASTIAASTSMFGSDISAIAHVDSSRLAGDKIKGRDHSVDRSKRERVTASLTGDYSMMSTSAGQDSAYSSLGHRQPKQVSQQDLDVMYARYLQSVFLDTKMRKVVAEKEKEAMLQLHGLWKENEDLARKKTACQLKLARLQHACTLDKQLHIQETGLGPVTAHLAQFSQQYSTLAHALDTTRHQIKLTDVVMPEDKDQLHYSLERALNESEHLLGEISMATRSRQPQLMAFSSALSMLEQAVASEAAELKRCEELLGATSSLATHETSLRIQQIDQRTQEE